VVRFVHIPITPEVHDEDRVGAVVPTRHHHVHVFGRLLARQFVQLLHVVVRDRNRVAAERPIAAGVENAHIFICKINKRQ
jgi:hypothetical protein